MICPHAFIDALNQRNISMFTGVPDSLLAHFCKAIDQNSETTRHVVAANEGNAVAMAIGHYFSTGDLAAVYMQNSGLGNAINPLVSLAAPEIYAVPMLLIIGWRGEPGTHDEPQHLVQGRITRKLLETLEIPYEILDAGSDYSELLTNLLPKNVANSGPVALLVRENTFSPAKNNSASQASHGNMLREEFIKEFLNHLQPDDMVVATTGKTSRELFELRESRSEPQKDFLTIGGMGHASSIALGIALGGQQRKVFCLDGDGAMLMHLGALATIGCGPRPENFVYVLLNNGVHESVGGQPTVVPGINIEQLVMACGFTHYLLADDLESSRDSMKKIQKLAGPVFLEVFIKPGARKDLGRPTLTPAQHKLMVMQRITGANHC